MKERIRQRAAALGFDDCRFTTAAPPETAGALQRWLAAGRHAGMGWLAKNAHKRADPQLVLEGVRSLIVVAASYGDVKSSGPEVGNLRSDDASSRRGVVARYARHADYHDALGTRLRELTASVNELGGLGTRSLWYVDTGPVLEREFAARAGIGFVGRHTNVVSRRLGNWILLGEILTTLELAPDAPEKNRCGACTRCLTACPTRALTAPFQLDARLCISYLTIELKDPIPLELRPAIGNRIFGCDDCLAACPWNRFAREGQLMRAMVREDLAQPELLELLSLDEAAFRQRFAGTPMMRVKRRGLRRNVCVALGNTGGAACLPALAAAAQDADPLVAEHAQWAVERIHARLGRV